METEMIINLCSITRLNDIHKDWIGRTVNNQLINDEDDGADVM
jgi:hypothetical protein